MADNYMVDADVDTNDSSFLVEDQGVDIILEVASSYKPVKGMMFSSIDQAFYFYSEYAKKAGFGAHKGGSYMHDGVLRTKYFTCCKEDHKPAKSYDSKVCSISEEVNTCPRGTIYELSNLNMGPVKAFNLMRTQYGGFEKVGATKDDCKNFKQGLNCFIGEYDAEMFVQRLCAKKKFSSDYSFEYDVNDNHELIRFFWADEISKSNYLAFGDIISFDVTIKTNKWSVGVGLLASETSESAPKVIVTDQDPAMKQAITFVFPNTWHRLCMWHIMKKVADKVGANLCNNEDFKRRICDIVWTDSFSPFEFEEKWQAIMVEFEVDNNKWLTYMYEIRFDWIPAFHRDERLYGLMRTTSRSESENHFFGQATNSQLTLVDVFNHFNFCMEIQRYNGRRCDHDSSYMYPELETRSYLEREAVRIYTRSISNDVQDEMNEIFGGVSQFSDCEEEGCNLKCKIWDFNTYVPGFLEVVFKKDGEFGEESIAMFVLKTSILL
ncbi:protein FAR-RED IMPAIRED RESPONSE 1-like [Bidens hawaiensis]|uniref:protein FAR-RED IMPAIRED RESPONSE 1-like n=1 Tax=Bidens hawaiensis TaxID=980011 RepID=UPI0040490842